MPVKHAPRISTAAVRVAIVMGAVCALGARASVAATTPLEELRETNAALRALSSRSFPAWSPEAEARRLAIRRTLDQLINFDELARRALSGAAAAAVSTGGRAEFVRLLRALTERRYTEALGGSGRYRIVLDSERIDGNEARVGGVRVPREAATRPVPIQYLLALCDGRWQVVDVVVDGASLVSLYQKQFTQVIKRESFDGLLARMREQLRRQAD